MCSQGEFSFCVTMLIKIEIQICLYCIDIYDDDCKKIASLSKDSFFIPIFDSGSKNLRGFTHLVYFIFLNHAIF